MSNREDLLVEIALLYYEKGATQTEIAKQLKLSRPTVASMLQEAKDKGIVKISIQHPAYSTFQKQESLKNKYHLENILIANQEKNAQQEIGRLCANLIEPMLDQITSLGIGWGTTIYEVVKQASYSTHSHLKIIPLIGGVGIDHVEYHANHLAFELGKKYECPVDYLYAPAIADTSEAKIIFEETTLVKSVLEEGKNVDLAIMGVGNPIASSTYREFGYLNSKEAKELVKSNTIGDIGTTFFNADGEAVHTTLSDRMIGLSIDDLAAIDNVVVVAAGKEKAESIKVLLNKQIIQHLVIDEELARYL